MITRRQDLHSSSVCGVYNAQIIKTRKQIRQYSAMATRKLSVTGVKTETPRTRRMRGSVALPRYSIHERRGTVSHDHQTFLEIVSLDRSADVAGQTKVKLENTYKMEPDNVFKTCEVEKVTEEMMRNCLENETYDSTKCKELSQNIAAKILERVKGLGFKRYKIVSNVSIGSLKEKPGMQFGSRCLWNKNTDNFVSVKYSNTSLFAVAMVYGLYCD